MSEHTLSDPTEPGERKVGVTRYIVHPEAEIIGFAQYAIKDWALMELKVNHIR